MSKTKPKAEKIPPFVVADGGPMYWVVRLTKDEVLLVPDADIQFSEVEVLCELHSVHQLRELFLDREYYPAWNQSTACDMSALARDSHILGQNDAKEGLVVLRLGGRGEVPTASESESVEEAAS